MKKRIPCLVLILCLLVGTASVFTSCKRKNQSTEGIGYYTYNDAVGALSANWNPHTYQTATESYPIDYITTGLYSFIFNDPSNPIEGKGAYEGYKIVPEMAADFPVDVTEVVRAAHPEYGIPESATAGYAYTIKLNPNAKWQNGEPINADTYVYSMRMLLHPDYGNYRATDYFDGSLSIANARSYYYQGKESYNTVDAGGKASLVRGNDGRYYTKAGWPVYIAVSLPIGYFDMENSLSDYVDQYGDKYFDTANWAALKALADENGVAPLTDESYGYLLTTITGNPAWGEDESYLYNYMVELVSYEDNYPWENVGLYKSGDYEITIVLEKSLAGFNLLYNLSGNWIVYQPYYDALMKPIEGTDAYATTYNTSVETTMSYGPYKMTSYILDKSMTFEKNESWFGYKDERHSYVHTDGNTYDMYQTDRIYCQVVEEADTKKLMFLSGQLMEYGLQADDFAEYRDSEYCYATPSETVFFFVFNGNLSAIREREARSDFDRTKRDHETMTLNSFRRAWALSFDKEAFCSEISPARSAGYGLIGSSYIYDPETGARYRDTDQAKKALCAFYSVDHTKFGSLDAAVDSITGYDPVAARALYTEAYNEAIEMGYITDNDGDGVSDQTIEIVYSSSEVTSFITKTINYFNARLREVTAGTPFEGRIVMTDAGNQGDPAWSENLKAGITDTCLCGWSGSALDPFGLTDLYTNPAYQYDARWFDSTSEMLTLTVDGKSITMNLREWSDALNGATVTVGDADYCFGDGIADVETRLDILAAIETVVLGTYNYIPMLQDASMSLLSKQAYYVIEEYNPIMGRGGIRYLRYNYDDASWKSYVREQGGTLNY